MISHKSLASGTWQNLDLANQLGNIGSEVDRYKKWKDRSKDELAMEAFWRALELIDLTKKDPRWKGAKAKEINRIREVLCDTVVNGSKNYNTPIEFFQKYFMSFSLLARKRHMERSVS